MDNQEIDQFLAGIKMAVMATINKDGSPHLSPNWYYYDLKRLVADLSLEIHRFIDDIRESSDQGREIAVDTK